MQGSAITFVCVVFETEIPLIGLQARSMAQHVEPEHVKSVLVIDNSTRGMSRRQRKGLLANYGALRPKVQILGAAQVSERLRGSDGWRSQQVLKLRIAAFVESDAYVVLDAKNHFVKKLQPSFFSHSDGRLRTKLADYRTHPFRSELEKVIGYLGIGDTARLDSFTPTVTPFALETRGVRELIASLEASSGRPFEDEFERADLLEFFLYGGWILRRDANFERVYAVEQPYCPIVWRRDARAAGVLAVVRRSTASAAPIFSVHRSAFVAMDAGGRLELARFWTEAGLFGTLGQARAFIFRFRLQQHLRRLQVAIRSRVDSSPRLGRHPK